MLAKLKLINLKNFINYWIVVLDIWISNIALSLISNRKVFAIKGNLLDTINQYWQISVLSRTIKLKFIHRLPRHLQKVWWTILSFILIWLLTSLHSMLSLEILLINKNLRWPNIGFYLINLIKFKLLHIQLFDYLHLMLGDLNFFVLTNLIPLIITFHLYKNNFCLLYNNKPKT